MASRVGFARIAAVLVCVALSSFAPPATAGPPFHPAIAEVVDRGVRSDSGGPYVHGKGTSVTFRRGLAGNRFQMSLIGGNGGRFVSVDAPGLSMACVDSTFSVEASSNPDWYEAREQAVGSATLYCYGAPSSGVTYRFRWGHEPQLPCVTITPVSGTNAFTFEASCPATVEAVHRGRFEPRAATTLPFEIIATPLA